MGDRWFSLARGFLFPAPGCLATGSCLKLSQPLWLIENSFLKRANSNTKVLSECST